MLQRDHVLVGMGVSLFFAFTFWFGLTYMNEELVESGKLFGRDFFGFRDQFIATMSVFSTIIPFIVYMRGRKDSAMRGVGMVTIVLALIVAVRYFL